MAAVVIAAALLLLLAFALQSLAVPVGCQFSTNCPTGNQTRLYVRRQDYGGDRN